MTDSASKSAARIYRLRLRALDSDNDADDIHRLRALLKLLLRRFRFRCIGIERERAP
jgi:hypothetical protein